MHAKEVDLGAHDLATVQHHLHWNASYEPEQLLAFAGTHTDDPTRISIRRHQSPSEEGDRVIEAEHGVVILDVILN